MAIIVNTNVDSLKVQRNLNAATAGASKAMERMTTGLKINNASDDAAGLVISKGIETQQRGSEVAIKNAQNGINLLQTAEGNLDQVQNHLLAIHDLTLQAMNGVIRFLKYKLLKTKQKHVRKRLTVYQTALCSTSSNCLTTQKQQLTQ